MKFTKILTLLVSGSLVFSALVGCGTNGTVSTSSTSSVASESTAQQSESTTAQDKPVKITFFDTASTPAFEAMGKEYHNLFPNVTVEYIPTGVGSGQQEKLQSLYASGQGPTLMVVDPANVLEYKDKLAEFSTSADAWLSLAQPGSLDGGTFDGKILGVPTAMQGYGLLYNKRVLEEAIGGTFDPSTIKTRNDLEALFKKIEAAGVVPTMFHGANWSLGSHYLGMVYAAQSKDGAGGVQFINDLKAGKVELAKDEIFNGYMDTFDLIAKYNLRKKDPLVADYNKDTQDFGQGKCATYFMGDWSWSTINALKEKDTEFGVIPVPLSNNAEDFGNSQIPIGYPKLISVDKSQNSIEQQTAAKKYLGWLLTEKAGQKFMFDAGLVLPYTNADTSGLSSMNKAVASYGTKSAVISESCFTYMPGDTWEITGASMQKYLVAKIDRNALAKEIEAYWKSKAGK